MPKRKNPSPRLGRGLSLLLDRPFKPSKKFEKQFPQAAKKREAAKIKPRFKTTQRLYDVWSPHVDTFYERLESLKDFHPQQVELPRGNLFDRIAVLANVAGSIDDAAEILDLDAELLIHLFLGGKLNRMQDDELNEQYSHFARSKEDQELFDIDIDEDVEPAAKLLTRSIKSIERTTNNSQYGEIFRQAIAEGDVDLTIFNERNSLIFSDLAGGRQLNRILDVWVHERLSGKPRFSLTEMFERYEADDYNIWDVEQSLFWEWFRELFPSD